MRDADEQRQVQRYSVSEVVFLVLCHEPRRLGKITDISRSGVAFRYVTGPKAAHPLRREDRIEIDIFRRDWSLSISGIPCRIAYDVRIHNESTPHGHIETRCCGLQFGEFDEEQHRKLKDLVIRYSYR